jgi:hypothetical protein
LRCGDGEHASFEPFIDLDDAGEVFVETALYAHKTASLTAKSKRSLSAVAHASGVSGAQWAEAWLARRQTGLSASREQPLTPVPLPNAQWSCAKLSNTEAAMVLRKCLKGNGCSFEVRNAATHFCKAKYKSMLEYSRDAQAVPLEWMRKVVQSIRESRFVPDATRSGRWKLDCLFCPQAQKQSLCRTAVRQIPARSLNPLWAKMSHGRACSKKFRKQA